jgi:phosphatidate cytidylyltransferase
VVSAGVLIPLVIAAVFAGDLWFTALIAIGAAFLAREWGRMASPVAWGRIAAAVALGVAAPVIAAGLGQTSAAFLLLVFGAGLAGAFAARIGASALDAAYGVFYLGWPCTVIVWLRGTEDGQAWTLLAFAIAWASDIAAYLIGKAFGGPKFWPSFSPNKTWSGFAGGMTAGVVAAIAITDAYGPKLGAVFAGITGLVVAGATMAGDLWESALKRRFGVKDTGGLIPGHGGLLDRVDGLMFAVVAMAGARLVAGWTGAA